MVHISHLVVFLIALSVVNRALGEGDPIITYNADKAFIIGSKPQNCDPINQGKSVNLYTESRIIFTVNIPTDDFYPVTLNYSIPTKTHFNPTPVMHVTANGRDLKTLELQFHSNSNQQQLTLPLPLRAGLNTISYTSKSSSQTITCSAIQVHAISIEGAAPLAARGATLPYVEIEAEDAKYVGTLVGPDRTYGTLASEASGRKAILLANQGDMVEWTVPVPSNAFSLRFSIPDAADGSGISAKLSLFIDGNLRTTFDINSRYSWTYGHYPFTKSPSDLNAHHFYDDVRVMINQTLSVGAKFRIVGASSGIKYHIDLVDFYLVGQPYSPPANALNVVTTYGADPTGGKDSYAAFNSAITDASKKNLPVWMPVGTYLLSQRITLPFDGGVTMHGAGPWYSTFTGYQIGVFGRWGIPVPNVQLYDFAVMGTNRVRNDQENDSGCGAGFTNSHFQNLHIEHTKVGMWLDGPFTQLLITGCTIRNTLADGINFHMGITNSTVEQCCIRNTADDGLAMWSHNTADESNTFRFNTVTVPILANCVAIYGGNDNTATDNDLYDSVTMGGGIHVGNRFSAIPLGGITTIARNSVTRCGAKDDWFALGATNNTFGGVFFWAADQDQTGVTNVVDTQIIDSTYEAIGFSGNNPITGVVFKNVTINGANFAVKEDSPGSANFNTVVAKNLVKGGQWNCGKKFTVVQGVGNSGWNDVHCTT